MRLIITIMILIFYINIHAEPYFGGEFKFLKSWYMLPDKWEMSLDNYHLFDIYIKNEEEQMDFKVRFQTRIWDNHSLHESDDLQSMGSLMTYEIIPWEIWAQINDIPIKRMSLKVGKQYFEWGTADGIHPSSVLNPDDYTDPFAMNEKIPVSAINLNYFISSIKIFLIWIPSFTPVKMPRVFPFIDNNQYELPGIELLNIEDETTIPSQLPDGMGKAVKLHFSLLDIDFSMGYFYGYDYMPAVKSVNYIPSGNMIDQFDLMIKMFFPKMQVYTMDFTTSIEGFGFWSEVGIYDYDKISMVITDSYETSHKTVIDGEPYASYVIGTDYTFPDIFYFNFQYAFGLPYVRGEDFLEDYFIFSLKNDYLNGLLEVELGNIFGFKRSLPVNDNHEIILSQEIKSYHIDNVIIGCIFSEIFAKGNVLFKNWKEYDSFEFYVSYSF